MEHKLQLYNTLSRSKEQFIPLHAPNVGMYVCGPTVYGDPHLGHARPAITFDILFRYLQHLGYKVRYVRNITDVGHLENDADEGEDDDEKREDLRRHPHPGHRVVAEVAHHEHVHRADEHAQALLDEDRPGQRPQFRLVHRGSFHGRGAK